MLRLSPSMKIMLRILRRNASVDIAPHNRTTLLALADRGLVYSGLDGRLGKFYLSPDGHEQAALLERKAAD